MIEISTFTGTYNPPNYGSVEFWITIVLAFVFLLLGALFIWLYYNQKSTADSLRRKYEDRSAGSFVGYWSRYRGAIYSFAAGFFILFGIILFLWSFNIIQSITTNIG